MDEMLEKAIIKLKKTQLELDKIKTQIKEPIAIIGMSCRFPKGANDPASFWQLLSQGYNGISEIPSERWDIDSFYDPKPEAPGKMYVRSSGLLNINIDTFDANFFGISPREAEYMDPQQRLLLEVTWEALENACINPLSLNGSPTGVFIGTCTHDYSDLMGSLGSVESLNAYLGTGNASSALTGRLSYFFGLQGPCLAVDTACSSSLVAINSACKSLQTGECQLAISGGVNIILHPGTTIIECKSHMLAKDGYCKTFDAEADGFGRGEGFGVIVLKRLSDTIRDQDPILAVIRATAVNQDGTTSGFTVPNREAQTALIREALVFADLVPNAIDYIEAHGTGTPLGDPIEVGALSSVFSGRKDQPLWIGSVKTNIGHLEAAAGIAGLIKTILALNNEAIPPNLHFKHLNPRISLDSIPAKIPLTLTPWQRSSRPRIAGVSSFGFSGTNAHAIIEEPPVKEYKKNAIDRPLHILTLSAKNQPALDQLIELYTKQLPEENIADIAFTANTGRAHFPYRVTVFAQTIDELLQRLQTGDYLIGQAPTKPPKITFLFTGQPFESPELMETSPVFKEAMERSRGLYEYAFFELWKSWGIIPDYVAGEGVGEPISAVAAGMITLEEGLRLIAASNNPAELEQVAKEINYRAPQIGFISSWTGQVIRNQDLTTYYWKPHDNIRNIPEDTLVISTQNNWKNLLQTLAQLYLHGIQIDWKAFDKPYNRKKVSLPTYPFQREHYWFESFKTQKRHHLPAQAHPLLGEFILLPSEEKLFRNEIDVDFLPFLKDYRVFNSTLFPEACFLELLRLAGSEILNSQTFTINNLSFEQPLALDKKKGMLIELLAKPNKGGYTASVYSIEGKAAILHTKGEFSNSKSPFPSKIDWEHLRNICPNPIDIGALYHQLDTLGQHCGKQFQTIRKIWNSDNEVIAELEGDVPSTLIEGSFQALSVLLKEESVLYLPVSIDQLTCFSELGTSIRIHGKLTQVTAHDVRAEIELFSYAGELLMNIQGFHARGTNQDTFEQMLSKQVGLEAASWFYQIDWQPKPLEKTTEQLKGQWLIVSDEEEKIEGLQSKTIKPELAVTEVGENPPAGILWFASGEESLKHLLKLVQALGKLQTLPSLYLITRGIQPVGPITDLENATFNGFYKTLRLEMPNLDCRHIDLRPNDNFPVKELQAADQEGQVAYAQGIRYVSRLVHRQDFRQSLSEGKQFKTNPAGSYLIIGGLGGLGLKVAEWLAKQGAKHLVLAGRRNPQKIEFPNAIVETVAIDISQKPAVDALMLKFGSEWPELKGIIHTAGVNDDGILSSQDWSQFEKVFAPKIKGSWNLHEASLTKSLDFFVLFSSMASSLGSPGQINYSSANAYMDALAYFRQEKGLPALAISWGPWAEVGMAANLTERHGAGGFIAFKPEEGIRAFESALTQTIPHISVAKVDWKLVPIRQAFLSELIAAKPAETPILLQRLTDALPSERKDILIDYLQRTVEKILGLSVINPDQGFFEAGMDSLMAVELRNKLQANMDSIHIFPPTLAFDYPSVQKLAHYFEEHIFPSIGIKAIVQKAALTKSIVETDRIAIIGLGCRFPQGANNPQAFWELLKDGYDGIIDVPSSRWNIDTYYDPNPETPGKMYVRRGGFLDANIETFDANFFGISAREAEYMDPQQRLLLEVAWEALESACINPLSLKGSETGVFMGLGSHDYSDLISSLGSIESINAYMGTGNANSILAGRLSYFLGLQGPSLAVDTACSSSLVALNYACKSLQTGECQLALAGGVNIIVNPSGTIFTCKARMVSKDGYCKTFDAEADGYVRSEGCGVIVLKRLSEAILDQDPIFGVIRATTVNQDGASSGLTVPNGEAQTELIRHALELADLEPSAIDYIEAHGTGTSLGDPIEVGALCNVFNGRKDLALWLGTVKTNIGHLEAAAGVAGVIKTVLALNHEAIPQNLHFKHLNPRISLDSIPAKIPLTLTPWQRSSRPRIAGISSFGFSGTNAHVIIEESPLIEYKKNAIDRPWHILTLSAKTQAALDQLLNLYTKQLPEEDLADIAFTANTGRAHFLHRLTVVAQTNDELLQHLHKGDYLIGQAPTKPPKITFIFRGQTVENAELMETSPIFKEALERSQGLYEYALFELWKSWGIVPDYVAGEGIGEPIAAIAAGMITLEEGLRLISVINKPDKLESIAREIHYREPQIGFISNWTGKVISKEGMTAVYWKLHEYISNIPEGTIVISTQGNWKDLLQTLSQLYLKGIQIDWIAFDTPYYRKKVSLPTYPFQRERYWIELLKTQKKRPLPAQAHPLLGEYILSPSEEKLFRNEIDLDFLPFLKDHQVFDSILFPDAGFLELLRAAGSEILNSQSLTINNLSFEQPLDLDMKKGIPIELLAKPNKDGYTASIYRLEGKAAILHAKGELSNSKPTLPSKIEWEHLRNICQQTIDIGAFYHQLDTLGQHCGKQFQAIRKIWTGDNEVIAELENDATSVLIDGSLQAIAFLAKKEGESDSVYLPYRIDQICCYSEIGSSVRIHGKLTEMTGDVIKAAVEIFSYDGKPLMKIEGFHARRTDKDNLQQMLSIQAGLEAASWFYHISWKPKPLEKTEAPLKQPWLIVSQEEEGIKGLQSKTVKPQQALTEIVENTPAGVLWIASGQDSLKHVLSFVQAFGKLETRPILYFITSGIQPLGPITDLENATFNGFYKTLRLEMANLDCRHIDLGLNEKLPVEELLATDNEGQVAYRQSIRYVPRLLHIQQSPNAVKQITIDPIGSYLITGGLGGLGLKVAEWLVKQGAKHLVLTGRRISQTIGIPNATVETIAVDVSQRPAVEALMQKFGREWPELKGIIHAAGVIGEGNYLYSQDWGQFEKVLAPKVQGSWNLHEASLAIPLDFFVLFSSLSSVLGLPRASEYAAANAYMDALAYFRLERGLPALAINWGNWAEVGMAAKIVGRKAGQAGIKPNEGIKALELALSQANSQISIVDMEWKSYPHQQEFLSELISPKAKEIPILLLRLKEALPSERKDILSDYLQRTIGKILGVSSINSELSLSDAGIDSLMAVELCNKLQADIGSQHKFPFTLAFDYPSVQKLTQYFEEHIFPILGDKEKVQIETSSSQLIVPIQPHGSHYPLFCIHAIDGGVLSYLELAKALGDDYPLYGIQAQGLNNPEQPLHTSLEEMVHHYIEAILSIQQEGPYHLGAWSAGGVIATEIAFQLEKQEKTVNLISCFDSIDPYYNKNLYKALNPLAIILGTFNRLYQSEIEVSPEEFIELGPQGILNLIYEKTINNLNFRHYDFKIFKRIFDTMRNISIAMREYIPRNYNNVKHICLFTSKIGLYESLGYPIREVKLKIDNDNNVEEYTLDCDHYNILQPPHINSIADILKKYISPITRKIES